MKLEAAQADGLFLQFNRAFRQIFSAREIQKRPSRSGSARCDWFGRSAVHSWKAASYPSGAEVLSESSIPVKNGAGNQSVERSGMRREVADSGQERDSWNPRPEAKSMDLFDSTQKETGPKAPEPESLVKVARETNRSQ